MFSFCLRKLLFCGVASVLCKKTLIFGSRRSKLDHLTVHGRDVETRFTVTFEYCMLKNSIVLKLSQVFDTPVGRAETTQMPTQIRQVSTVENTR